jgi:hypothetical protein
MKLLRLGPMTPEIVEGAVGERPGVVMDASVVLVEPGQLHVFNKRLKALNKKALAFGLPPIAVLGQESVLYERRSEWVGSDEDRLSCHLVPVSEGATPKHPVELQRIRLSHPLIKLGDWLVVGKLEYTEGGNLVFCVTGEDADAAAVKARGLKPLTCEHCGMARKRSGAFVLRSMKGEGYKEVGSSCLRDFTGIDPATALFLAKLSSVISACEDDLDEFLRSGRVNAVSTVQFLSDVAFLCKHGGFISSSKANETGSEATFSEAQRIDVLLGREEGLKRKYETERDAHLDMALQVRAWVLSKRATSDFDDNAKLLLKLDALKLERRHLAFAAATVPMYMRSISVAREQRRASEHIGTKGERVQGMLIVDRVIEMANPFGRGVRFLVLIRDAEGNRLTWKTTSAPSDVVDGTLKEFEATFKVKAHTEYREVKQTEVTHVKVVREQP